MTRVEKAAASISGFTLASRVLGLVRDVIMFRVLGASWVGGTFILAWTMPNLLRRLLGEGALSASFIPAYAAAADRDPAAARRLLAGVTGTLTMILAALTALVWVLCAALPPSWLGHAADAGASATASGTLLVQLTALLFPYVIAVCLVATYAGALNSLGVFGWPAALPVLLNVFWLAGLGVGAALASTAEGIARISGWFLLAAGVAQLATMMLLLAKRGAMTAPRFSTSDPAVRKVFVSMAPTVLGMSMLQLNTLLDQVLAYYLIAPGANSHIYVANRLLLFPHALTALALATAVFPQLAVLASRTALDDLGAKVDRALRMTLFLATPASAGLVLVAGDLLEVCFVGGAYTNEDAQLSAATTACLVGGLPFVGVAQLCARALYAIGDLRSPARIATILVPVNLALNLVLVLGLGLGVPGLALATSACAVAHAVVMWRALRRRCPIPALAPPWLARLGIATAVMSAAVAATRALLPADTTLERAVFALALPIGIGITVYGAVHWSLGTAEVTRFAQTRGRGRRR
ncbi:MAG: murein biosynthesis integral membrane protein MurJ [Planctomycetota bacterium]